MLADVRVFESHAVLQEIQDEIRVITAIQREHPVRAVKLCRATAECCKEAGRIVHGKNRRAAEAWFGVADALDGLADSIWLRKRAEEKLPDT